MLATSDPLVGGGLVLVTDDRGQLPGDNPAAGLYAADTRFLDRLEIRLGDQLGRPVLHRNTGPHGSQLVYLYSEPSLVLRETRILTNGQLTVDARIQNFSSSPEDVDVEFRLGADFRDMLALRGFSGGQLGGPPRAEWKAGELTFSYRAIDGLTQCTRCRLDAPSSGDPDQGAIRSTATVPPQGEVRLRLTVEPVTGLPPMRSVAAQPDIAIASEEESFAAWMRRSLEDLTALAVDIGHGPVAVGGLPYFAVPFGRDAIVSALQALPFWPELSAGTLRTLAAYQGRRHDPWRDESPGKILHELRFGELSRSGQIPFGPYYGSVDATPLFLALAGEYYRWTGDAELVEEIWPALEAAVAWADTWGDLDGDGLIEHPTDSPAGLRNQGWKDSGIAFLDDSGQPASGPMALAEVQAYAYLLRREWAYLRRLRGDEAGARKQEAKAKAIRAAFLRAFWLRSEDFPAMALDGRKQPVPGVGSNPLHGLWTGLLSGPVAARVAQRALAPDLFSGWGIRTLSRNAPNFHPFGYHTGAVWPHDTAFVLWGLRRHGFAAQALRLAAALWDAAGAFPGHRLPELFAGFDRESDAGPIPYPAACSPQAWAAGAGLLVLRALLGLEVDASAGTLRLSPRLPNGLKRLSIRGLAVAGQPLHLVVESGPRVELGGPAAKALRAVQIDPPGR